jgi:hypothetical protein
MPQMTERILYFFAMFAIVSCSRCPAGLEQALQLAGGKVPN